MLLLPYTTNPKMHILSLKVPGHVQQHGHKQTRKNGAVVEQLEGNARMLRELALPDNEERNTDNAEYKHNDDIWLFPICTHAASNSKRNQNERQHGSQENDTNDVHLPKEPDQFALYRKIFAA